MGTSRSVRQRAGKLVAERFGQNVEIEYAVALPEEERAALQKYLEHQREFDQLGKDLAVQRVAIAERLLALQLTQEEVAEQIEGQRKA